MKARADTARAVPITLKGRGAADNRQMRGGRENAPRFGARMSGEGIFAELQEQRFRLACARHGLNLHGRNQLDTTRFKLPAETGQLSLF